MIKNKLFSIENAIIALDNLNYAVDRYKSSNDLNNNNLYFNFKNALKLYDKAELEIEKNNAWIEFIDEIYSREYKINKYKMTTYKDHFKPNKIIKKE